MLSKLGPSASCTQLANMAKRMSLLNHLTGVRAVVRAGGHEITARPSGRGERHSSGSPGEQDTARDPAPPAVRVYEVHVVLHEVRPLNAVQLGSSAGNRRAMAAIPWISAVSPRLRGTPAHRKKRGIWNESCKESTRGAPQTSLQARTRTANLPVGDGLGPRLPCELPPSSGCCS